MVALVGWVVGCMPATAPHAPTPPDAGQSPNPTNGIVTIHGAVASENASAHQPGPILADLCEVIYAFDCDWLLLSGRVLTVASDSHTNEASRGFDDRIWISPGFDAKRIQEISLRE
jgi:hypothetical protein